MTIKEAYTKLTKTLTPLYGEREAQNIAKITFEDAFQIRSVFHNEKPFPKAFSPQLLAIQNRLLQSEPLQYILGEADFYGLKFNVSPAVLIPRPETEELVYAILQDIDKSKKISVLDIGTGSGCIPISLKKECSILDIHALDVSLEALAVAKENAVLQNLNITFYEKNILDKSTWNDLPEMDIIVSNPPYIPQKEAQLMHDNVLAHEPHLALFVEDDNALLFYDVIADFAVEKLKKEGRLYFEINEFLGEGVRQLLESKGFENVRIEQDMQGKDRIAFGQKKVLL